MIKLLIPKFLVLGIIVGISLNWTAQDACSFGQQEYLVWANVLKEYVDDQGKVNYGKLKENRTDLDAFLEKVRNANIDEMSDAEQKAFWINAYNALTLQTIIDHYPVKSIRFINFGLVWKMSKHVAQEKHSLGDIEHEILRPLGDPRIHFALNCASIGCPKLPKKPFDPQQLDQQLDFETRRFMNDTEKVRLDREENILYHSELLNWYEDDFLFVAEDKLSYIKEYLNEDDRAYLNSHEVVLKKIKYDWNLNKQ